MSLLEWDLRDTMREREEIESIILDVTQKLERAKERQKVMRADLSKVRQRSRVRTSKEFLAEAFQEVDSFIFTMELKLQKATTRRDQLDMKLKRLQENLL